MFIIAEIGSNWTNFEQAKDSIAIAKNCGADAVKFQLFTHKELYGVDYPMDHELPREWVPKLAEKAQACGIEFMVTAFSPEGYDFINPFVKRHKVASAENSHPRILEKVTRYGKPVLVSTGATTDGDLAEIKRRTAEYDTTLLYCKGSYPSNSNCVIELGRIVNDSKFKYGISDHSLDIYPNWNPHWDSISVYEKHFKAFELNTPDSPHSLGVDEFSKFCKWVKLKEFHPSNSENDFHTRHNRRIIATKPIAKGDQLFENVNIGIFRAKSDNLQAARAWDIERLSGKLASQDYAPGDGIRPTDMMDG